jgi:hypothetical protein
VYREENLLVLIDPAVISEPGHHAVWQAAGGVRGGGLRPLHTDLRSRDHGGDSVYLIKHYWTLYF